MADNITVATTNDAAGAAHQKVVNEYLDAGGLPIPVSATNPLPVLASISTAGLATSTGQNSGNASLTSIDGKTPALGQALATASAPVVLTAVQIATLTPPAAITGFATETTLATVNTKLPTGLTVTANRLQVELPAGGGGLTNTELRATAVPVSLTSTTITGSVAVTGGLTDTQIRATPLPISGTVVTGGLTDTQIRATALPVSLLSDADTTSTGTLALAAQTVVLLMGGKSASAVSITGTWVGTITFEGSVDGTTFNSINAVAASTSQPQPTTTVNGLYRLTPAGLLQIRVIMTTYTSGTANISMRASAGTGGVFANQILPSRITDGTNTATIKPANTAVASTDLPLVVALHPSSTTPNFTAAQPVTGAFFQATQPISGSVSTGGITDTQIRATPLPVTMSNTLALTDTQIRATPLPISGTIANTGFNVTGNSLVSTVNSTSVALAANAVFTGASEDISEFSTVFITVFSDQASAVDGLSIQQSSNGTNWDFADVYSIPIASGKIFSTGVQARFLRIVYTNGAVTSTILRLQTLYSKNAKKNSSVRPQDGRTNDNDFEEELSFLMGYNSATNAWDRLRTTIANGLDTNPTDRAGRLLGVLSTGANTIGAVNINGTVPVSLAINTPTLQAGSTTAVTQVTASNLNMTEASASTILARTPALGQVSATVSTPVTQNIETASGNITTQNLVPAGAATAGSSVEIILSGSATLAIQTTGTYTGALTLQVTSDGTNWVNVGGNPLININTGGYLATITSALQSVFQSEVTGFLRARITALGVVTGTATITLRATASVSMVSLDASLPSGTAVIGGVTQSGVWTAQIGNTPNTTAILANPVTPTVSVTGDTGAKVATGNGATQTNTTAKGAHIIINMGAVTGTTPTFVAKLQGSADGGTTWYDLPNATTASLVATGVFGIMIYPSISAVAGTTTTGTIAQTSSSLPRNWRLVWTIGGTTPSFSITNVQVSYLI